MVAPALEMPPLTQPPVTESCFPVPLSASSAAPERTVS